MQTHSLVRIPPRLTHRSSRGVVLHPVLRDLPSLPMGPFVRLGDGRLMCFNEQKAERFGVRHVSPDRGRTWDTTPIWGVEPPKHNPHSTQLIRTASGVIVAPFVDVARRHFPFDEKTCDAPGAVLPTCVTRSEDDGATWSPPITLHEQWTGSLRDAILTREGVIVFTTMKMLNNPAHHAVLTYRSCDQGRSWAASNVLSFGGRGHHDGLMEPTITQRRDGSLMMLIRTNWDYLWLAESTDLGHTWHPLGPTCIDHASAPPILRRLASGRLLLVWNRLWRHGGVQEFRGGGRASGRSWVPGVRNRQELSAALSDDDGETWHAPLVIAGHAEGEISYPTAFEVEPGVIWITTTRGPLRVEIREADLLEACRSQR